MTSVARRFLAGVAAVSLLLVLFAVPSAANADGAPVSGTVTSGGHAAGYAYVHIMRLADNGVWRDFTYFRADSTGQWTFTPTAWSDGSYAIWYETKYSTTLYTANQSWDGEDSPYSMAPEFSVTGGVPSQTNFPAVLAENAGVVIVKFEDDEGAPLPDAAGEDGEWYFPSHQICAYGYLPINGGELRANNIAAGTYDDGFAYAYQEGGRATAREPLDDVSVVARRITTVEVRLHDYDAPTVADELAGAWVPTVMAQARVGTPETITPPPIGYSMSVQWYANGTAIVDATGAAFTPTSRQLFATLSAHVLAKSDGHVSSRFVTGTTAPVVPAIPIPISPVLGVGMGPQPLPAHVKSPGRVLDATAKTPHARQISVKWHAPAHATATSVTGYQALLYFHSRKLVVERLTSEQHSVVFRHLTRGVRYRVKIRAVNATGHGSAISVFARVT